MKFVRLPSSHVAGKVLKPPCLYRENHLVVYRILKSSTILVKDLVGQWCSSCSDCHPW